MLSLSYILFCVSGIATGNENGIPYDVLGSYLDICGTTISILNCYPRIPLIKALFLVIFEAWIIIARSSGSRYITW